MYIHNTLLRNFKIFSVGFELNQYKYNIGFGHFFFLINFEKFSVEVIFIFFFLQILLLIY